MDGHEKTAKLVDLLLPATEAENVEWKDPSGGGGDLFRCHLERGLVQVERNRVFIFTYPNAGLAYLYKPKTDSEKQRLRELHELVQYQMNEGPEVLEGMIQELENLGTK